MTGRFFNTEDGARIHYRVIEGILPRDTLFIHGNMASHRWWEPSEAVWRRQSQAQQTGSMIVVDFRGCGLSSAPRSQADVDMNLFAEDFIALARSLNRGPLNLVGHSTGGLIAALMLAKAPEMFHKAVLLDPVGGRGVVFDDAMTTAFEQMKADKDLVALVMGSTIWNNDPDSEFFRSIVVEDAYHAVQNVGDKVLRALAGFDSRSALSGIKHCTLVLHGEHDVLLPQADSEEMARLMSAQFSIIPGHGHCANVENPEKFVAMAGSFLFSN